MPLRNSRSVVHRPLTVTDAVDGTNALPNLQGGSSSMLAMANVVPAMHTVGVVVPRPAAYKLFDFGMLGGLSVSGELLQEIGNRAYGFVTSSRFPGYSEPFCYDFSLGAFAPIQGVTPANLPLSAPATGDWEPPTMVRVGAFILFSHPGFSGANAVGWLDQTGFKDTTTGNTAAGSPFVAGLAKNTMQAGWRAGMSISDSSGQIPPGTRIASVAVDGLSLTMTSTAGAAVSGDILTVTGGTPSAPLWSAGNTSINPLPGHVTAVSLFNGRAEYAVDNSVAWSDAGDPLVRTNANQAVTIQNGVKITALSTQPFSNATVIGGVVQGLLIFQGDSAIWQLTGDPATSNLALNFMSPLGTLAPLTLASLTDGTYFVAPDGVRKIQLDGTVSEPLGAHGQGVTLPFVNALYPSRMCAAYNEDAYRVSVTGHQAEGGSIVVGPVISAEYWYHFKLQSWSGPHTFPAKFITSSNRPATNHGFLMFPLATAPGAVMPLPEVWFSNTRPLIDATYVENGQQLNWTYQTTLLPDTQTGFMNAVIESTIFLALGPTAVATVVATDEIGNDLDEITITGFTQQPAAPLGKWGTMVWGTSLWGGEQRTSLTPSARRIAWHKPIVFRQMTVEVTGISNANTVVGNLYLRYQQLGYQLADPGIAA